MNELEPLLVTGSYVVQKAHSLNNSPLDVAIAGFQGAATRFSMDAIKDAKTRASYMSNIKRISAQTLAEVSAGNISAREGVEYCQEMRNKILLEHRKFTSIQGLAFAEKKKKLPPTLHDILDRYSNRLSGRDYKNLSADQKSKVYYAILESSGRDNAAVSNGTKIMRVMGKVGILVTAAYATYEILNADNLAKEAARQTIVVSGGAAGGRLAALGVPLICGPGALICAVAVVLAGSVVGGVLGSVTAEALDDELEEFSRWEAH
jgi:hypothetical protein